MQPHTQSVNSGTNAGEDRLRRRRRRRLKRRVRIIAPFLGVPLLLAALSLSVDLVEYEPTEEPDRLSDRPIRMHPKGEVSNRSTPANLVFTIPDTSIPSASDQNLDAAKEPLNRLDLGLAASDAPKLPTSPALLRSH